jgi:hypothetical protein
MVDYRVAGRGANLASKFDSFLSDRLRDGVVSDKDLTRARQIVGDIMRNPPPRNAYSSYAAELRWERRAQDAETLYRLVSNARFRQGDQVTGQENVKDRVPRPYRNRTYGTNYHSHRDQPVWRSQPSMSSWRNHDRYNQWGDERWRYTDVARTPKQERRDRNIAIGLAVFAGLAALAANHK